MRDPERTTSHFYPQTIIDSMIKRIEDGESLRTICSTPGYPSRMAWWRWVTSDKALSDRYTEALRAGIVRRRNLTTTA